MQDLGGAVDKLKDMLSGEDGAAKLQSMLGMFMSGAQSGTENETRSEHHDSGSSSASNSPFDMPDMEMLLKLQRMMSSMSENGGTSNGHAQFLQSLKPYLSGSRKGKIDTAAKIMQFTKMASLMKVFNSDD